MAASDTKLIRIQSVKCVDYKVTFKKHRHAESLICMKKYKANICQHHHHRNQENTAGDHKVFWVMVLVLEHVTQEFLHGSVSDGPVEEQQLYPLRIHEAQRREEKKQLSKPERTERGALIN